MSEKQLGTILVVDDREENRYITSRILRSVGFNIIEGRNGKDALVLAAGNPDLIVLDIRLPDLSGYDVCKRLKANPATCSIPVLHLSASFISTESKVMSLEGGADAYLTQPAEPPVLVATVRALLRLGRAEAISRLSARQWQVAFDSLSEGIGLLDAEGRVRRCNRVMSEIMQQDYAQMEGKLFFRVLVHSLGIQLSLSSIPTTHQSMEVESISRRWFRVSIDPVFDEGKALAGGIFVLSEITDRKRAEELLRVSEQHAATGRLAHSIAHEINNPLATLTNLIYLLGQSQLGEEQRRYLAMAREELARVSRIAKQTLSFYRESSTPVKVNVQELVDGVLTLYGPQLSSQQIDVYRQYDEATLIEGFPSALKQVISNLISNAMDAVEASSKITVRITHSCDWRTPERVGIRISIADQGPGIPAEIRRRIFEAFFTTKEEKGSGLGLWLSCGIVQKHGGSIRMRSSVVPGKNFTCFSIFLPYQPPFGLKESGLKFAELTAS